MLVKMQLPGPYLEILIQFRFRGQGTYIFTKQVIILTLNFCFVNEVWWDDDTCSRDLEPWFAYGPASLPPQDKFSACFPGPDVDVFSPLPAPSSLLPPSTPVGAYARVQERLGLGVRPACLSHSGAPCAWEGLYSLGEYPMPQGFQYQIANRKPLHRRLRVRPWKKGEKPLPCLLDKGSCLYILHWAPQMT